MTNEAQAILEAASRLAEAGPGRRVPSPSSVMDCTRRLWFIDHEWPRTEPWDGESAIAAQSGTLTEPYLAKLVEEADIAKVKYLDENDRELNEEELARVHLRGGQVDAIGERPDGSMILIEFKRKGVFQILDRHRDGSLLKSDEREYMQIQAMLHGKDLELCFYLAVNWDRSALTNATKRHPRFPERPPGVYTEWIRRADNPLKIIQARGDHVSGLLAKESPSDVPREFDPKSDWQCQTPWCGWRAACLKA